ncbi:MAG: MlaD family protein [Phycisphaerales bacterium]
MSARAASRNNLIAGVFVVGAVVLAVAISIVLSGIEDRLTATRAYLVRFSTLDGTAGLEAGSLVKFGGQKIGRVTRILIADGSGGGEPPSIDVGVALRADLRVHEDAVAYLVQPILGGLASINLPTLGSAAGVASPRGSGPEVEPGEAIPGRIAPPSLLSSAGYGEEQVSQVQGLIRDAAEAVDRVNRVAERIEREVEPTMELVRGTLTDARQIAADLRGKIPEWTGKIDTTLASMDSAAADFDAVGNEFRDQAATARNILNDLEGVVERNVDDVEKIIADVSSATGKLDGESVRLLNELLKSAEEGAERFSGLVAQADQLLDEEAPSLRKMLANFRLASDQIKLATVEIRTKPWLLLYSPKTKELESELLQSTARTYAEAVSDLRAASEALESAAGSDGSPLALERESIVAMTDRLARAFKSYEEAERKLLDLLIEKRP